MFLRCYKNAEEFRATDWITPEELEQLQQAAEEEAASSEAADLVSYALGFVGCSYVYGGNGPTSFDCSGFTQYAFARAGISLPRTADVQMYSGRQISASQLRPGDLIFFSTYEPGPSHCGIYLGNGQFIHAGSSTGVTVSSAFTGYWGARYYGACRVI